MSLSAPMFITTTKHNVQVLEIDNDYAHAAISLFGGHVMSFIPKSDQRQRLWLSEQAIFDAQHAIRGGVPVCWPWFGDHQATRVDPNDTRFPAHGYVRKQQWKVVDCRDTPKGSVIILQPNSSQGDGFDGHAQLSLVIQVGPSLTMQLLTENTGKQPFSFTCALHSYFAIDDIHRCELKGLSGDHQDKARDWQVLPTPSPYTFTEETDRVHLSQPKQLTIVQDNSSTNISSRGHDSIVVWNPWSQNSAAMADMTETGFAQMLCVETAITQGHIIEPGESHTLEQIIT
jgi:glucose-6-phosphate 1-epimerase